MAVQPPDVPQLLATCRWHIGGELQTHATILPDTADCPLPDTVASESLVDFAEKGWGHLSVPDTKLAVLDAYYESVLRLDERPQKRKGQAGQEQLQDQHHCRYP